MDRVLSGRHTNQDGRSRIADLARSRPGTLWSACIILLSVAAGVALALGVTGVSPEGGIPSRADVMLLLTYVLLALVVSFLCSIAEAALLSVTPSFIAGLHETRPRLERDLRRLKQEKIDQSLAAILTLNTIAHTVGAIGAGSKATAVFGSAWFGAFSAIMTLLILFLSEIIPKTLGAVYWRQLARPTALFIRGLILLLYPLIRASDSLTRLIARDQAIHVFSRDEFLALAGIGKRAGQIEESELRVLRNLFRFGSLTAHDVMTPRTVMVALRQELTVADALEAESLGPFSRVPIYGTGIDDVTGWVLKNDLLLSMARGDADAKLGSFRREIRAVAPSMPLSGLLELLIRHREQIVLVVDEHGGVDGLVTLEDVVETLLGMEIVDEQDTAVDMRAVARQQWEKRAHRLGLDIDSLGRSDG